MKNYIQISANNSSLTYHGANLLIDINRFCWLPKGDEAEKKAVRLLGKILPRILEAEESLSLEQREAYSQATQFLTGDDYKSVVNAWYLGMHYTISDLLEQITRLVNKKLMPLIEPSRYRAIVQEEEKERKSRLSARAVL